MPRFEPRHVQQAFDAIRQTRIPAGFGPSTKWDIIDDATNDRFPPKAVLFLAKSFAGDQSRSGGGGDRGTNNALRERGFSVILKTEVSPEAEDIEAVLTSPLDVTTKQLLVNARLGQGSFRESLIEIWGKCALTDCEIGPVLRASHIQAWRASNDRERLDPNNGILLAASIDALFDKHLITITEHGRVRRSSTLSCKQVEALGLKAGRSITLGKESQGYLEWHRAEFDRLSGGESVLH